MAQWSALVIGLLCVLVSVALKTNVFPEMPRANESEKEWRLDTDSLHDVPLERLHARQHALCAPLDLPLSDCVCLALGITLCIVGVCAIDRSRLKGVPIASLLLLGITLVHVLKKRRGRSLRQKYEQISEVIGAKTWKSLND